MLPLWGKRRTAEGGKSVPFFDAAAGCVSGGSDGCAAVVRERGVESILTESHGGLWRGTFGGGLGSESKGKKAVAKGCPAARTLFGKYGGTMNRALTKADIVEAIYEKTDRNRADVKNTVEILLGLM